jgi:urease accessory protein
MAVTAPSTAGNAFLHFARRGSITVLTRAFAASPVKVFATSHGRVASWVYAATLGGGLVGGDEIEITAQLEPESRALLTTQASTKIYRSTRRARQTLNATVGSRALLAVMPDPVVCFASADYAQTQRYTLSEDANLVLVDWMSSGRHATGERWAFSRYESRISISRSEHRIFHDAIVLETDGDRVVERMRGFNVLLTAVVTGPLVTEAAQHLLSTIASEPVVRDADTIVSASKLSDGGTLLRVAAVSVEDVGRTIRQAFQFLCPLLGDDPWSRKW